MQGSELSPLKEFLLPNSGAAGDFGGVEHLQNI